MMLSVRKLFSYKQGVVSNNAPHCNLYRAGAR